MCTEVLKRPLISRVQLKYAGVLDSETTAYLKHLVQIHTRQFVDIDFKYERITYGPLVHCSCYVPGQIWHFEP